MKFQKSVEHRKIKKIILENRRNGGKEIQLLSGSKNRAFVPLEIKFYSPFPAPFSLSLSLSLSRVCLSFHFRNEQVPQFPSLSLFALTRLHETRSFSGYSSPAWLFTPPFDTSCIPSTPIRTKRVFVFDSSPRETRSRRRRARLASGTLHWRLRRFFPGRGNNGSGNEGSVWCDLPGQKEGK